jgi:cytochrome c553
MNSHHKVRSWVRRAVLAAATATFTFLTLPAGAQGAPTPPQQAPELAIAVCGTCHGVDGNSINPMFPRLAGQRKWYIEQQLKEFRAETRGDPYAVAYMWGMANQLSDPTIDALAEYFSQQTAGPGKPHPQAVLDQGRTIYEHGIPTQGVPACAACHGPQALGSAQFPRLAGQHAEYILKQLQSFQSNMRKVAIMHGVAQTLHASQMKDVADYLESLP